MGRTGRFVTMLAVSVVLAAAAWLTGFVTALTVQPARIAVPDGITPPPNFPVFAEVWSIVEGEFRGALPAPADVTIGSVRGLLAELDDPYAEFVTADEAEEFARQAPPDVIAGIGIWIEPAPSGALVVATVPNSPARRSGLVPGDLLIAVEEEPTMGLSRGELLQLLDGAPGTSVVLRVLSVDELPESIELVRAEFPHPLVEVRQLDEGVGYVRLSHFGPGLAGELDAALGDLAAAGSRSLVLDLRDNPGGDLEALRATASRFVAGPLWIEERWTSEIVVQSIPGQYTADFESVAVLVNEGTASAAEILASLLRETMDAPLIGTATFGKPAIQGIIRLQDGSMLRLSVARWTTPGGLHVNDGGLDPDRAVEAEEDQVPAALAAVLNGPSGG